MLHPSKLARPLTSSIFNTAFQPRYFHPTTVNMVKVGDKIPDVDLFEASPGDKVNLSKELKGKGLIIGVPAAFSKCLLR